MRTPFFCIVTSKKEAEKWGQKGRNPKRLKLKYDSLLLLANKSTGKEYILISKQEKMTLNIIFLPWIYKPIINGHLF